MSEASTTRVREADDGAPSETPYLSIVAAARNDDHGGGLLARMQVFVDALVAQCRRHGVDAELILVEWNPPGDRPRLGEAIRWPKGDGRVTVRIIEVSPELHSGFEHSDRLALFQMIAKNAGIRRARGRYVLATNIDLLFTDGILRRLGERLLEPGVVYRADRYDVEDGVPAALGVVEQLRWCEEHPLRIRSRTGTRDLRTGASYPIYAGVRDLPRYAVARSAELAPQLRTLLRRGVNRARGSASSAPKLASSANRPALPLREAACELRRLLLRLRVRPYTNACGDFTLMAREHWLALRGYPELELYSLHIDSLLLYMSHYAGLRELTLPDPVYHLEHSTGFSADSEGKMPLFDWLDAAGIPWLTSRRFADYVVEMAQTGRPLELNRETWGLGAVSLPEQMLAL